MGDDDGCGVQACLCLVALAAFGFLTLSPALEVALEYQLYRANVYEDVYKPVEDDTAALKTALFEFKKLTYDKLCKDVATDDPKAFDCADLATATEEDPADAGTDHPVDAVTDVGNSQAVTKSTVLLERVDEILQHKHGSADAVTNLASELASTRAKLGHVVAAGEQDTASRDYLVTTATSLIVDGAAARERFGWLHDTALRAVPPSASCPPLTDVYGTRVDSGPPVDAEGNPIVGDDGEPVDYIHDCEFLRQDATKIMRDHQVRMLQCGFSDDAIPFTEKTTVNCNDES